MKELTNNDLKSYIKSYYEDRKITYTRLDKHDRAIGVLINENERLNNIINEFEKCWKDQQEKYRYYKDNRYRTFLSKNLNKLQELKGDSSNE